MFIHLLTPGGLSWTRRGVPKDDASHDRIKREKRMSKPEDLCRGLPAEFEEFLRYCRRLKFSECPDYGHWIEEFRELAKESGYPAQDDFIWPPAPVKSGVCSSSSHSLALLNETLQLKPLLPQAVARRTPATPGPENVEQILHDLANLKLDDRPVLGERKNINNAIQQAKADAKKPATEVIVISDDTSAGDSTQASRPNEPLAPAAAARLPKAARLNHLSAAVAAAADNQALSQIVLEFATFLQSNRSRTLTKEGFAFLDALYKQLADPSVYIVPLRTSRTMRSENEPHHDELPPPAPRHVKLDVLAALKREVGTATSNQALAKMIADFGAVTNKSSGRTVTKDGFAFLEGLAARLKAVQ